MADYSIWILEEGNITVGGGQQLDGITQGDGSHLLNQTIRLNNANYLEVNIRDGGSDTTFDDQDGNQRLDGSQTIDGVTYGNNTPVEGEYTLTLEDPDTLQQFTAIAFNVNNSNPSFATVEGLSFVGGQGGFPPVGKDLRVIGTDEGPGAFGNSSIPSSGFSFPICFTPGTMIETAAGPYPVERLRVGDLVRTRDHGLQPVRWIGRTDVASARLATGPQFHPVRIARGALGPDRPTRALTVSQQHRVLLTGWRAELLTGEPEVLAPARHLVNDATIRMDRTVRHVTYLHLLFDGHEVITANGLWTESFFPGAAGLGALEGSVRDEVLTLFPELAAPCAWSGARTGLRPWESAVISA
ncbi:MAG: Hint domain-containing protein [Pseudomonadota bacterium]